MHGLTLPDEDTTLLIHAQLAATGSNVHRVRTAVAVYRNEVALCRDCPTPAGVARVEQYRRRLAEMLPYTGPSGGTPSVTAICSRED